MSKIVEFQLPFDSSLEEYIKRTYQGVSDFRIISKGLDARKAQSGVTPKYFYRVLIGLNGENLKLPQFEFKQYKKLSQRPIIVGAGPAGLFCALRMAQMGNPPLIIERGDEALKRMHHISKYWRHGILNPESNVCYGEGGAGLFSDGKLITRVKSPHIEYVMRELVSLGAPEEIYYLSNPHLGSNKIRLLIVELRKKLQKLGCEFYMNTKVESLNFEGQQVKGVKTNRHGEIMSPFVVLATGHSAHNIYQNLLESQVTLSQKDFAVGLRVEHKRKKIDQMQFGPYAGRDELGAARYRLSYHDHSDDKGTYSFCMCPGGIVLSSGTDVDGIVVNGMSNYAHNTPWSNSALVVSVKASSDFSKTDILAGVKYQRDIEKAFFSYSKQFASGKEIPALTITEFLAGKLGKGQLPHSSVPSKTIKAPLYDLLPLNIVEHLRHGLTQFDRSMKGFVDEDALLLGPETRTSAAIRINRDKKTCESTSHKGLFPAGEGAGYAGGITSAAVDGVNVAEALLALYAIPTNC